MEDENFNVNNSVDNFDFDFSDINFDELDQSLAQQGYQYEESGQQQYQQQQYQPQMQQGQMEQQDQMMYGQNVQQYGYPTTSDTYQSQAMSQSSDYSGYHLNVAEPTPIKAEEPQIEQPQVQLETQHQSLKRPYPGDEDHPTPQQSEMVKPDDVVFAVPELPMRKIAKAKHMNPTDDFAELKEEDENGAEAGSSDDKEDSLLDKAHINMLRQTVLHPVAPPIVEKMHALPPVKESKDDELKTLILNLQRYESVIPDPAARYIMNRSGINPGPGTDICARFLAVAAQKVVTDVLSDAITMARSRGMGQTNRATKETKYLLTQELVSEVLHEQGLSKNV
uniref:Transcription initiation factor TFIID subunit 10 n=1 Tax=Panagrellus redivivus TaxID=6233 RepID=A0A7E4VYP4_PANRE